MTNGERIVQSIERWLRDGALGDKLRADAYRRLISCGFVPPLDRPGDIGTIHTSCAIFARAILHDSGVMPATRPGHVGWPMWGGWLGNLSPEHPAWVPYVAGRVPVPGALFYIESPSNPYNNHVGFWVQPVSGNTWRTAEGGGGDGTRCDYTTRDVIFWQKARNLEGWFDMDRIAASSAPPEDPDDIPTHPEGHPIPIRTLRRGMKGEDVRAWQTQLGKDGWLLRADGDFGVLTDAATRKWQAGRGLEPDGVVGPKTRAAIGTPPKRQSSSQFRAVKPDEPT